jgi:hypothetical protein
MIILKRIVGPLTVRMGCGWNWLTVVVLIAMNYVVPQTEQRGSMSDSETFGCPTS